MARRVVDLGEIMDVLGDAAEVRVLELGDERDAHRVFAFL
jgi:hypothetical protein